MSDKVVAGIDLGGSYVKVGIFEPDGTLLIVHKRAIHAQDGAEKGVRRILNLVSEALAESGGELMGIGMGVTGPVDTQRGLIQNPYTLPGWENVPMLDPLQDRFHVPAKLDNDADVAALGEYWKGAGRGVNRLYAVTIGTGIGTAFVLNGSIYRGMDDLHPEGGHQILDPSGPECYCGAHGCWESLASGPAIARRAQAEIELGASSLLLEMTENDPSIISAELVAKAAKLGDVLSIQVMERTGYYLGLGLVNCVRMFLPEMIVLSGGVMEASALLLPTIHAELKKNDVMQPTEQIKIVLAKLGYHAGLYGAAYSILKELEALK